MILKVVRIDNLNKNLKKSGCVLNVNVSELVCENIVIKLVNFCTTHFSCSAPVFPISRR